MLFHVSIYYSTSLQKEHLWWSLFFNKVEGHQTCGFIKKRLQQIFSCEFREIYKNTYFEEKKQRMAAFLERFMWEHFFRSELSTRKFWWLAAWKVAQISQDWTKMFPIIKYNMRREKIKFLKRAKPQLLENVSFKIE